MLQHLTRPYQYEQLNKRSEQMYKLIAICIRYAAVLLLYYCCTTAVLLLYYCFTTAQQALRAEVQAHCYLHQVCLVVCATDSSI